MAVACCPWGPGSGRAAGERWVDSIRGSFQGVLHAAEARLGAAGAWRERRHTVYLLEQAQARPTADPVPLVAAEAMWQGRSAGAAAINSDGGYSEGFRIRQGRGRRREPRGIA